jgi:flagellar hook-associated protein 2
MSGESYAYRSITQVGITYDKDGSLSLDEAKLKEALSKDFDAVAGFFLGYDQTVNAGTSEEKTVRVGGMLTNMGESLKGLTDPLRNPIKNALSGLDNNIRNLQDSIAAYELRLQTREDLLYTQFSAADEALRMMRVTLGNISGALASLTNNSN